MKKILGRTTLLSFPQIGLENITAKVDTGAFRSVVHCHDIKLIEKNDQRVLSVHFLDPNHPLYNDKELIFAEFSTTALTSIFGHTQRKFVVKLKFKINGSSPIYVGEFSLVNRKKMRYPVLLGRSVIAGNFLVDVSRLI